MVSSFIFRGQDILRILTNVNNDVSLKEGKIRLKNKDRVDAKMTPQPQFTLRKLLIFKAPKVRTVFFFKFHNRNDNFTILCSVCYDVLKTETLTTEYCSVADLPLLKLKCLFYN